MTAAEYRKLIIVVWLLVAAAMAAIWGPRAWSGRSWDTDDFMRLVQVRDLLDGQDWSDLTQHRLDPPAGTPMHWSRAADVPITAIALVLSPFLAQADAVAAAGLIIPPLYYLLFLIAFALGAKVMLGAARAPAALLVAISGSAAIAQFVPGRVDHHGLQLVCTMAAVSLLLLGLAHRRWGAAIGWAGVPFALSVWIGVETLPIIAAWFAALGLAWCWRGGSLAGSGARAALLAAGLGCILIVTSVARPLWWPAACDGFSVMPVGIFTLIGTGFAAMAVAGRWARTIVARVGVAAACGALAAGGFALAFPACVSGGYGALDPLVAEHWLSHVSEAMTLSEEVANLPFTALGDLWTPLLGLGYCLWRIARGGTRARLLWGTLAVILICATAMLFWQVRAASFSHAIALLPLSGLIADLWIRLRGAGRIRRVASLLALLFAGSFALWPAVGLAYRVLATGNPQAPATTAIAHAHCGARGVISVLDSAAPTTILGYIDIGSMLLFNTQHGVLGAPYHRDNDGLRATIELFRSSDDAAIERTLAERGIGWVVTCPGVEERSVYATAEKNGLAERLAAGQVPDYLEAVGDPAWPGLRFYRIRG